MSRGKGLALVLGLWALLGAWFCLFIWPLYAGIAWLVVLFLSGLYAALFVWPKDDSGVGGGGQ